MSAGAALGCIAGIVLVLVTGAPVWAAVVGMLFVYAGAVIGSELSR